VGLLGAHWRRDPNQLDATGKALTALTSIQRNARR
jgi:hypothetical protein